METAQHLLLVLDSELRVVRATRTYYKMFGVRPEDTLGRTPEDLGSSLWRRPELRRLLEKALSSETPLHDLKITQELPRTGPITMKLNARRIRAAEGQCSALLAVKYISERRGTAEIHYRRLFESAPDGIIVLDCPSGTVLDLNPSFLKLTQYAAGELLNRPFRETPPFLEAEEMRRLVQETLKKRTARYDSIPLRAKNGQRLMVEIVASSYRVRERSFIQVGVRDATERWRHQEDLRRSNQDLQQFAFTASHDLQEPLRTITSFVELLRRQNEGKLGPQADRHIRFITGAADRMRQLVLDLLGLAQVARAEMNLAHVKVEEALRTALLNLESAVEKSQARITFDPLPVVYADETQLVQLLQNLIGNSIKYRGEKPLEIHLSARETPLEWVISVQDNGIGIDMQYADQIFAVFKRLHGGSYPGTGVGLTICQRIVERHGGRIWVESERGKGSTFYFTAKR